jgi:hypothetical protein
MRGVVAGRHCLRITSSIEHGIVLDATTGSGQPSHRDTVPAIFDDGGSFS